MKRVRRGAEWTGWAFVEEGCSAPRRRNGRYCGCTRSIDALIVSSGPIACRFELRGDVSVAGGFADGESFTALSVFDARPAVRRLLIWSLAKWPLTPFRSTRAAGDWWVDACETLASTRSVYADPGWCRTRGDAAAKEDSWLRRYRAAKAMQNVQLARLLREYSRAVVNLSESAS